MANEGKTIVLNPSPARKLLNGWIADIRARPMLFIIRGIIAFIITWILWSSIVFLVRWVPDAHPLVSDDEIERVATEVRAAGIVFEPGNFYPQTYKELFMSDVVEVVGRVTGTLTITDHVDVYILVPQKELGGRPLEAAYPGSYDPDWCKRTQSGVYYDTAKEFYFDEYHCRGRTFHMYDMRPVVKIYYRKPRNGFDIVELIQEIKALPINPLLKEPPR